MKKTLFSCLMLLLTVLTIASVLVIASYADDVDSGTLSSTYFDVTWKYNKTTKTLTIKPNKTGWCETGSPLGTTDGWGKYAAEIEKVVIGGGMAKVTSYAFMNCVNLQYVELGSGGQIDAYAFNNCGNLRAIYKPGLAPIEGVADISGCYQMNGGAAFSKCGIGTVILHDTISTIPDAPGGIPQSVDTVYCKPGSPAEAYAKERGLTVIEYTSYNDVKPNLKETVTNKVRSLSGGSIIASGPTDSIILNAADYPSLDDEGIIGGSVALDYSHYDWMIKDDILILKSTATGSYNDTGYWASGEQPWAPYADRITKMVIGDGFQKAGSRICANLPNLTLVEFPGGCYQLCSYIFEGDAKLQSVRVRGNEFKEGYADLTKFSKFESESKGCFAGAGIKNVVFNKNVVVPAAFFTGSFNIENAYATVNDESKALFKEIAINLIDLEDEDSVYRYYEAVDSTLPFCGPRATYRFDDKTGTLYITGSSYIDDTFNYYGGGARSIWWASFKKEIKKVVLGEKITRIGNYAFCQCDNLEYVEYGNKNMQFGSNCLEKCSNLRGIYLTGTTPIEGTADLTGVTFLDAWSLSDVQCIENVILNGKVEELTDSIFYGMPLKTVYGVPGSGDQTFAKDYNLKFEDASKSTPKAVHLEAKIDEGGSGSEFSIRPIFSDKSKITVYKLTGEVLDKVKEAYAANKGQQSQDTTPADTDNSGSGNNDPAAPVEGEGSNMTLWIILGAVALCVVAAVVILLVVGGKKKKAGKTDAKDAKKDKKN